MILRVNLILSMLITHDGCHEKSGSLHNIKCGPSQCDQPTIVEAVIKAGSSAFYTMKSLGQWELGRRAYLLRKASSLVLY